MLPLLKCEIDITVKAALLRYWQLTSKTSDLGLTRLLKMLNVIHPEGNLPSSCKVMKSLTRHLLVENPSEVIIERDNDFIIHIVDFEAQIKLLI